MKDPIRVTSYTRIWKALRRLLKPTEWAVWLLGLPRSRDTAVEPGLILIQIDGLSRTELVRALEHGRMPFLKKLIEKEQYDNHVFYSGIPASTPSVQGELYYGVRTIVPAFGFRDHRTGQLVRMFASDIALDVENSMEEANSPGLLDGGSSYANIYGGGAKHVHFCATSFGWSEFFSTLNPLTLLFVMLLNFWMFARVVGLAIVEFFQALFGFVRGIIRGRQFWQELVMIPARVVVVVLLRELVTTGACFDAARGVPIIHLNLLGYDEQAHRRGPSSKFAHRSLRAIDFCIRRIWKAAHQGAGREYDIWVFSDHGQETTKPYQLEYGELIQQVVADQVAELCPAAEAPAAEPPLQPSSRLPSRANWLGIGWLVTLLFGEQDHDIQTRSNLVQTVTSGPLGFVYLLGEESRAVKFELAKRLVRDHQVPQIFLQDESGNVKVVSREGVFGLPGESVPVFGSTHPFLEEVADDMIRLTRHVDSGDLVLVGWRPDNETSSFVLQNGAHAGPGIEETRGFAMLPPDAPVRFRSRVRYLRPDDLRLAALRFLERNGESDNRIRVPSPSHPVRLLTYNVHACVGMDGQLSPERIGRVIAQTGANVVCLQELDVNRKRSGFRDQVAAIAKFLEMEHHFQPAWNVGEERFGNAILSTLPMRIVESKGIHHYKADRSRRSAIWAELELPNAIRLQVINTHMSIYPKEQLIQARELITDWVQPAMRQGPVVLCGDFNSRPQSKVYQVFTEHLRDVESATPGNTRPTYFSPYPMARFDHIFHAQELVTKAAEVVETRLAKIASDHLPLLADFAVRPVEGPASTK